MILQNEKDQFSNKLKKNEKIRDKVKIFDHKYMKLMTNFQTEVPKQQYNSIYQSFASPLKLSEDENVPPMMHSPQSLMPQRLSRNGFGRLNSN